jgi:hypothetical protein
VGHVPEPCRSRRRAKLAPLNFGAGVEITRCVERVTLNLQSVDNAVAALLFSTPTIVSNVHVWAFHGLKNE